VRTYSGAAAEECCGCCSKAAHDQPCSNHAKPWPLSLTMAVETLTAGVDIHSAVLGGLSQSPRKGLTKSDVHLFEKLAIGQCASGFHPSLPEIKTPTHPECTWAARDICEGTPTRPNPDQPRSHTAWPPRHFQPYLPEIEPNPLSRLVSRPGGGRVRCGWARSWLTDYAAHWELERHQHKQPHPLGDVVERGSTPPARRITTVMLHQLLSVRLRWLHSSSSFAAGGGRVRCGWARSWAAAERQRTAPWRQRAARGWWRRCRPRWRSGWRRWAHAAAPHRSPLREERVRVELVGSHGRWKRPCLQTAHMTI
jgi:hypothetical protein